jgi:hypothetical protein
MVDGLYGDAFNLGGHPLRALEKALVTGLENAKLAHLSTAPMLPPLFNLARIWCGVDRFVMS